MARPDLSVIPEGYKGYVTLAKEYDFLDALDIARKRMDELVQALPEAKGEYRYGPDKWTIKELLCHLIDAERIFTYRALRFARNDKTALHGFEENDYAPEANAHGRTLAEIAQEAMHVRQSTVDLYKSFTPEMLQRSGTANGKTLSVFHLGYVIAGHELHHYNILRERYLQ
ncbi:DinB family protein [Fulvivirgaceae bacterium PWU5]|uniref:DinB family protein n=1 Tax=Dawidia cretensis TaxID=2782350 RepID=A0AAP2GT30_9BACT|nr:DinB family protein [Dawidia cretensis]MBT1706845.1 DinB family protein [Dawidia cretensis]